VLVDGLRALRPDLLALPDLDADAECASARFWTGRQGLARLCADLTVPR
jgi:hypothetical protein